MTASANSDRTTSAFADPPESVRAFRSGIHVFQLTFPNMASADGVQALVSRKEPPDLCTGACKTRHHSGIEMFLRPPALPVANFRSDRVALTEEPERMLDLLANSS